MISVLVVDDDFHVAHAHALAVARTGGFTVVGEAHGVAEAKTAIAGLGPDLVLLDMYLPDGSGLDVMRALAGGHAGDAAPDVVVVTAARDVESVREAMRLGAFYYLVKPFAFETLAEQLTAYQAWRATLDGDAAGAAALDQEGVDRMFSLRSPTPRPRSRTAPLPPTMQRVLDIVAAGPGPVSTAEVAEALGASRPTAQRHLAVLLRRGLVDLELAYGTAGRPEHRYVATARARRPGGAPRRG